MKYSEDMIGDVREYLQGEVEETCEYLYDIGQEWCRVYDLYDLYSDYCGGELSEVINLFVGSRKRPICAGVTAEISVCWIICGRIFLAH